MYSKEKLLKMLANKKASVRYEACEWIRVSQESSPRIIKALEKAIHDEDKEVAERASLALQADVHHQMAIQIGLIEPNNTESQTEQLSSVEVRKSLNDEANTGEREPLVTPQGWKAKYRAWPIWRKILFWALPILTIITLPVSISIDHSWHSEFKTLSSPYMDNYSVVAQGEDGCIWLGTSTGLYMLNGENWMPVGLQESGLPGGNIHALAVDPSGRLWVAASANNSPPGLAVLDGAVWKSYPEQYQDFNQANAIAFSPDGQVWIGYGAGYGQNQPRYHGGIRVFDGQTWTTYTMDNSRLPDSGIMTIGFDDSGRAWISTEDGEVAVFDGSTWKVYMEQVGSGYHAYPIAFDTQSRVLVGTWSGLLQFDGQSWTRLQNHIVTSIEIDQSGRIYASSFENLIYFEGTTWVNLNSDNSFLPGWIHFMTLKPIPGSREVNLLINGQESGTLMEISPESLYPKPVALVMVLKILNNGALLIVFTLILLWLANLNGRLTFMIIGLTPMMAFVIISHKWLFNTHWQANTFITYPWIIIGVLGGLLSGLIYKGSSRRNRRNLAIFILVLGLFLGFGSCLSWGLLSIN